MLTCHDVANYFLVLVDRESGDSLTQLKLQKLVYFAQGISLSLLDKPLFKNKIEAWANGPVVRELRKSFGSFEKNPIPSPGEIDFDIYDQQHKELIYKVFSTYGEHSASYLWKLTHNHSLWIEAFKSEDKTIYPDQMKEFFKKEKSSDFLILSGEEKEKIINAEDNWWMHYDSGIPSEDITDQIL